ncbi:MAG TPA: thioredoxin domain-containing protein [Bacteroidia bacterium]|jgi:thioredoxin|nr:thioredoxin domain-containing protein [Bacteroidia bacterium]
MKTRIFISAAITLLIASCTSNNAVMGHRVNVDPNEFNRLIDSVPSKQIVDVRTAGEFSKGHIKDALNLDWKSDDFESLTASLNKDLPVFVYCLSGTRSSAAADWFTSHGYKNVYQLTGGILAWEQADLPEEVVPVATTAVVDNGELTTAAYAKFISSNPIVLVDFSAVWCGPCQHLKPKIEELKNEMPGKFVLLASDVDRDRALADSMNIQAMPTLLIYKNGELKWRQTGDLEKKDLKKAIESVQ